MINFKYRYTRTNHRLLYYRIWPMTLSLASCWFTSLGHFLFYYLQRYPVVRVWWGVGGGCYYDYVILLTRNQVRLSRGGRGLYWLNLPLWISHQIQMLINLKMIHREVFMVRPVRIVETVTPPPQGQIPANTPALFNSI